MYDFVCVHTKARTWILTQVPTALVAVSAWAAVCHGGHRSVQDKVGPGTICKLGGAKHNPFSLMIFLTPVCAGSFAHLWGFIFCISEDFKGLLRAHTGWSSAGPFVCWLWGWEVGRTDSLECQYSRKETLFNI